MRVAALASASLLAACSAAPPPAPAPRSPPAGEAASAAPSSVDCVTANRIKGTSAQLTLVSGEASGVTFDAPRYCPGNNGEEGAQIQVPHHGRRKFNYHPGSPKPCDRPGADPAACPTINVHVFGEAVLAAARAKLGERNANSYGMGLCDSPSDPLEKWHLSFTIHDWKYANDAIRVIDAELARWDVEGGWGLSITGIACAVSL